MVVLTNTTGCATINSFIQPGSIIPKHNISEEEIISNTAYGNKAWEGRERELCQIVFSIADYYFKNVCIRNETDNNERAIDLWNMLNKKSITPIIAVGNMEMAGETFDRCNHSWIMIFYNNSHLVLEPNNGTVYSPIQNNGIYFRAPGQEALLGTASDELKSQYLEAWYYSKPSEFKEDIRERW